MAVTATALASGQIAGPGTSFVTASVAPSASKLQLLAIAPWTTGATITNPSISGNGLTWVQIAAVDYQVTGGECETLFLYRALVVAPSSGTATITASETWESCAYSWVEFGNVDTSGTNGSGAVKTPGTNSGTGTSLSVTITASDPANAVYAALSETSATAITPGGSAVELHDVTSDLDTETQWINTTSVSSMSGSWTGTSASGGIAIELKVVATTGTALLPPRYRAGRRRRQQRQLWRHRRI